MAAQPSALEQKLAMLEKKLADFKSGAKKAAEGEQDVVIHRIEAGIREVKTAIEAEKPKLKKP